MLEPTPDWKAGYPGAAIGVLAMEGGVNPKAHPDLDRMKAELAADLRDRYADDYRQSLRDLPGWLSTTPTTASSVKPIMYSTSWSRSPSRARASPAAPAWSKPCLWPSWSSSC